PEKISPTALTTVDIAENPLIIFGINPTIINKTPPTTNRTEDKAANIAIFCFVDSDKPLNHVIKSVIISVSHFIAGINALPMDICASSKAEFNSFNAPLRLSCIISAISFAAPSELYSSSASLPTEPTPDSAIELNPFNACSPNTAARAASLCSSLMSAVATIKSSITSVISRICPSASYSATVWSPTATAPSSEFFFKSRSIALSVVPAIEPLIPLSAKIPKNAEVCSISMPAALALAPTYLSASPNWSTSVFVLLDAAAKASVIRPASSAFIPNMDIPSVTMSAVLAKSIPDAAAKFRAGSIPATICDVSQPANAMYFIASADSDAENTVVAPISRALSDNISSSFPDTPLIAATSLMPASKSAAVLTALPKPAPIATPVAVATAPTFLKLSNVCWLAFPKFCNA